MEGKKWNRVLLEWVNCLKLCKYTQNVCELRNGEFFNNLQKLMQKSSETPQDILTFIFNLLDKHYPKYVIKNKSEIHLSDLPETDLKAVISLLMHYTCIYDRKDVLTSPLCHSLSQATQIIIRSFLQKINTNVSNDSLNEIIKQCIDESSEKFTNQWLSIDTGSDSSSPLQDLLKTPVSKVGRRQEKDRIIAALKSDLELERYEKADLQEELKVQCEKNKKIEKQLSQKNSEISRLRGEVIALENRTPPHYQDQDSRELQRRLRSEIQSLEQYIQQIEKEQEEIRQEKDTAKEKLRTLETECNMWQEKYFLIERNCENLDEHSREQDEEISNLKTHCSELSSLLEEYRNKASNNDSSLFDSFAPGLEKTKSLDGEPLCEDLACSVIEVQLLDAHKLIEELKGQLLKSQEESLNFRQEFENVTELLAKTKQEFQVLENLKQELGIKIETLELENTITKQNLIDNEMSLRKVSEMKFAVEKELQASESQKQELQNKLEKKSNEITTLFEDKNKLLQDIEELKLCCDNLKIEETKITNILTEKSTQLDSLENERIELLHKIETLEFQYRTSQDKLKEANGKITEISSQLHSKTELFEDLEGKHQQTTNVLLITQKKLEEAENECEKAKSDYIILQNKTSEETEKLMSNVRKYQEDFTQMKNENENLLLTIRTLEVQYKKSQDKLMDANNNITEMKSLLQSKTEIYENLKEEHQKTLDVLLITEKKLEDVEKQQTCYIELKNKITEEVEELKLNQRECQDELIKVKCESENLSFKLQSLKQLHQAHKKSLQELKDLQEIVNNLKGDKHTLETELNETKDNLKHLNEEYEIQQKQCLDAEKKLLKLKTHVSLKQEILESKIEKIEKELDLKEITVVEFIELNKTLSGDVAHFKEQYLTSKEEIEKLKIELSDLQESSVKEIENRNNKLKATEEKVFNLQQQNMDLSSKLQEAVSDYRRVQENFNVIQNDLQQERLQTKSAQEDLIHTCNQREAEFQKLQADLVEVTEEKHAIVVELDKLKIAFENLNIDFNNKVDELNEKTIRFENDQIQLENKVKDANHHLKDRERKNEINLLNLTKKCQGLCEEKEKLIQTVIEYKSEIMSSFNNFAKVFNNLNDKIKEFENQQIERAELNKELDLKLQLIETHKIEKTQLESQVLDAQQRYDESNLLFKEKEEDYISKIIDAKAQYEELKLELDEIINQSAELKNDRLLLQRDCKDLKAACERQELELNAMLLENKRIDGLLLQSKDATNKLEQVNEDLIQQLQATEEKLNELSKDHASCFLRARELDETKAAALEEIANLQEKIQNLSDEKQVLDKKLEIHEYIQQESQKKTNSFEETLQDYEITISGLKKAIDDNLETASGLREERATLKEEIHELQRKQSDDGVVLLDIITLLKKYKILNSEESEKLDVKMVFEHVKEMLMEKAEKEKVIDEMKTQNAKLSVLNTMFENLQVYLADQIDFGCMDNIESSMKKICENVEKALKIKDKLTDDLQKIQLEKEQIKAQKDYIESNNKILELALQEEKQKINILTEEKDKEAVKMREKLTEHLQKLEVERDQILEQKSMIEQALQEEKEKTICMAKEKDDLLKELEKLSKAKSIKSSKENILAVSSKSNIVKSKEEDLKKENMLLKKKVVLAENAKNNLERILKELREEKKKSSESAATFANDAHYKMLLQEHISTKEEYEKKLKELNERYQTLKIQFDQKPFIKTETQEPDKKLVQDLQNIREAYGNVLSVNSKLELENVSLRKIIEDRNSDIGDLAHIKEAYEKLLEENNKLMMETDTLKYKRIRDKEEFVRLLKKDREEGQQKENRKIQEIRSEYEGKLEKMKDKMLKLYREEVNKEVQKFKAGKNENSTLLKTISDLKSNLFEMEQKVQLLEMERDMLRTKNNTDNDLHYSRESLYRDRDSIMSKLSRESIAPTQTYSRVTTITSRNMGRNEDTRRATTLPRAVMEEITISRRTSIGVPNDIGRNLQMEDEEDLFNDKYLTDMKEGRCNLPVSDKESTSTRYSELAWRNSLVPPHLKSSYPAEIQFVSPSRFKDEDIKTGHIEFEDSLCKLLPGEKPRKKDFGTTSYKKPGPPTPSKNGGRLSLQGNEIHPLRDHVDAKTPKKSTPSRIKALFTSRTSSARDNSETQNMTPNRSRRLNIFRRPR